MDDDRRIAYGIQAWGCPGFRPEEAAWYRLPCHRTDEELRDSLSAAPHLSMVRPQRLLEQCRGHLQVILLTENRYAARQTAVHLAALAWKRWAEPEEEPEEEPELTEEPVLAALSFAGPALGMPEGLPAAPAALLLDAPGGHRLTEGEKRKIEALLLDSEWGSAHCFLALRPEQVDEPWVEELRFRYGYQICRVGRPEQEYLCRVLRVLGAELGLELREVDLDRVVDHLRAYRGSAFCEEDLERLLLWCVQRQSVLTQPLRTADLLFRPVRYHWSGAEQKGGESDV